MLSWALLDRALPVNSYLFEMGQPHSPPESSFGEGLARRGLGVEPPTFYSRGLSPRNTRILFFFFLKSQEKYACIINVHVQCTQCIQKIKGSNTEESIIWETII